MTVCPVEWAPREVGCQFGALRPLPAPQLAHLQQRRGLARGLLLAQHMRLDWLPVHLPTGLFAAAEPPSDARRQAGRRRVQRGVTPLELAAAVGLIVTVGVVASLTARVYQRDDSQRVAEQAAERIRTAAEQWQQEHAAGCPTISQLMHDRALDADARVDDPWGSRYRVVCSGPMLTVCSSGKDGETGTADDIRVPRS